MHDNLTKHKILKKMSQYLIDNRLSAEYPFDYVTLRDMCGIEIYKFGRIMTNLQTDEYIKMGNFGNDTASVVITKRGASAATSDYFKKEDTKIKMLFLRDFSLTLANIIVAIAAVKALNKDATNEKKEIEVLKAQVDSITRLHTARSIVVDTLIFQPNHSKDSLNPTKIVTILTGLGILFKNRVASS